MHSPDRLRRPFGALLKTEIRIVGLAILREGSVALALLAGVCVLMGLSAVSCDEQLVLLPEFLLPVLPMALLLPWIVWKGDPVFGPAFIWTLPVRRQEAAAAKIMAGAAWLMLAVAVTFLALALTSLATGGAVGVEEVRLVGVESTGTALARSVPWMTPFWMWLVPFGGALIFYLASSAALLGLRYPFRWLGAAIVTLALLLVLSSGPENFFFRGLGLMAEIAMTGSYGLDFALTGGVATLSEDVRLPGERSVQLWSALPHFGRWATATLVWLGLALVALGLAIRRHWER
jgi:hypothetical protein